MTTRRVFSNGSGGVLKGDFNEDPTYGQILTTMFATAVPGLDQLADLRDITANVYLLQRKDGKDKTWAWLALVTTLVGFFPVVGSLLKGFLRIMLKSMRSVGGKGLDAAVDALGQAFARLGAGDPAAWVAAQDVGAVVRTALRTFDEAMGWLVGEFRRAERWAQSGAGRVADAFQSGAGELVWRVGNDLRSLIGRAPAERTVRATPSLAARIGGMVRTLEGIQVEANRRIAKGVEELMSGLERLVARIEPSRPTGRGVSGGEVRPGRVPESSDGTWRPRRVGEYDHDLDNPGPLANNPNRPDRNFRGMRYNVRVLEMDTILYRGGHSSGRPLGEYYTWEPPTSAASVRIDGAVREFWINPQTGEREARSIVDWVYPVRVPKGTTIYEGPVGSQGGIYLGGEDKTQVYVEKPWLQGATALTGYPIPRP